MIVAIDGPAGAGKSTVARLLAERVDAKAKHVIVLSDGQAMVLHRHATVTICHSKTKDLPAVCREAAAS